MDQLSLSPMCRLDWIFHILDRDLVEVSFYFIVYKFGMFNLHKFKILSERSILFGATFLMRFAVKLIVIHVCFFG